MLLKHPLMILLMLSIAAAAVSGWSWAAKSDSIPADDLQLIAELADETIAPEERLYVVTVRGEGHYMLRYTATGPLALAEVSAWMEQTADKLQQSGFNYTWNINVQGWLHRDKQIGSLWSTLEQQLSASKVESYEDAGSQSVSYRTDRFHTSITSRGKEIHFQAAAHLSTETNQYRVTLGTPVILIEY